MTVEELKDEAVQRVAEDNPNFRDFKISKVYENIMDGTLVTVSFHTGAKEDSNHVHFGKNDVRVYRWFSDVLTAIGNYKERLWIFRFLEMVGIGGLIAFMLILIFSVLLCVLAFSSSVNQSIVDVVKLSFTIILGYFFGQTSTKK